MKAYELDTINSVFDVVFDSFGTIILISTLSTITTGWNGVHSMDSLSRCLITLWVKEPSVSNALTHVHQLLYSPLFRLVINFTSKDSRPERALCLGMLHRELVTSPTDRFVIHTDVCQYSARVRPRTPKESDAQNGPMSLPILHGGKMFLHFHRDFEMQNASKYCSILIPWGRGGGAPGVKSIG